MLVIFIITIPHFRHHDLPLSAYCYGCTVAAGQMHQQLFVQFLLFLPDRMDNPARMERKSVQNINSNDHEKFSEGGGGKSK